MCSTMFYICHLTFEKLEYSYNPNMYFNLLVFAQLNIFGFYFLYFFLLQPLKLGQLYVFSSFSIMLVTIYIPIWFPIRHKDIFFFKRLCFSSFMTCLHLATFYYICLNIDLRSWLWIFLVLFTYLLLLNSDSIFEFYL